MLERQAPKAAGEPQVEWPGALDGEQVTVSWRIRAKEARASLGYSNDGGDTWTPVSLPTAERAITFDARGLPGGTAVLELLVSDGFHTSRARFDRVQGRAQGLGVWLLSPAPGASLPAGVPVQLAAQGYHLEERRPGTEPIVWTSSIDGGLGEGGEVLAALSPGQHTVAATMAGLSADVTVDVQG